MTRFVVVACAVLGLSELAPARAQFVVGPGYGYGYSYRSGFGFAVGGPHLRVGFSSGFVSRSAFVAPPFGLGPVVPVGPFGPVPPLGPVPPVGFAPAFGFAPPVVVQPIIIGGNFALPDPEANAPRNNAVALPRGAKETDFFVIAPKKATVPEVTRVADPRPLPLPVPAFDPFKPAPKLVVEKVDPDPKKEAARLVKLALTAFAAGDYGRAAEHFDRASDSDPADARTYFLHAQARFAAGQYADAVARVRDGLARDPKWPASGFDPADLYAGRADRYATHLAALKKAVADNPGQPALEFLLGYQLWFGGEKAEAAKLFRAAETRLAAPGPIALFK